MSLDITSSSFCGQLVADIGVVLEMQSYSSNSLDSASRTNQFVLQPNATMYFGVSVLSSPKVSVSALDISWVTLSSNGLSLTLVLYYNGLTTHGSTFGYVPIRVNSTNVGFGLSHFSDFYIPPGTVVCLNSPIPGTCD